MKLITKAGELVLPEDYSITMEITNPFFSDDGDASIPADIPASSENLKVLQNIDRIDNANRPLKKVEAKLSAGLFQKTGQLIVDTVVRKSSITACFAIENSDLYVQSKDKSIKDIFKNVIRNDWNGNVATLANYLNQLLTADVDNDFCIFTTRLDEVSKSFYLNEVSKDKGDTLYWESRTVKVGDDIMGVPDGYGVSPFLYFHRFISLLFETLGYTVENNIFASGELKDLTLVNNCVDSICRGYIYYADLVPSCTLGEFIEFLKCKFCVQIKVDSENKTVRLVMLQEVLRNDSCDLDISDIISDNPEIMISDSSRVTLSSETSLESAEPAAETFDELIDKYGFYFEVSENEFNTLECESPAYNDCLILRKSLGHFYTLLRNINTGRQKLKYIGTFNFKYDRNNSVETTALNAIDEIPSMSYGIYTRPTPFCGGRLHFNSTFDCSENETEQKIIIVWKCRMSTGRPYGTTSKWNSRGLDVIHAFSLNTYDMYDYFFSAYNEMLLNNMTTIRSCVLFSQTDILNMDIMKPKYAKGQKMLLKSVSFSVADRMSPLESEMILVKDFIDGVKDSPILPGGMKLRWQKINRSTELVLKKINELGYTYPGIRWFSDAQMQNDVTDRVTLTNIFGTISVNEMYDPRQVRATYQSGGTTMVARFCRVTCAGGTSHATDPQGTGYRFEYTDSLGDILLPAPSYVNEISHKFLRNGKVKFLIHEFRNDWTNLNGEWGVSYVNTYSDWTIWYTGSFKEYFKAVAY